MQLSYVDLGIWPALPLTGYIILRFVSVKLLDSLSEVPIFTKFALYFATGMAIWSVPLLGSAVLGVYNSKIFGLIGWPIIISAVWILRKDYASGFLKNRAVLFKKIGFWELAYFVGMVILGVLYYGYPNESILGGRDMGVYANHGIFIATHGYLRPNYPIPYESFNFPSDLNSSFLPGLYATTEKITVQFGHLFPVWLAQAFNTFGGNGLFRLNALLALLSLGLFRGLLQRFVSLPYAVLGTLFLGFNVSEIWLARITLTEILTQMWVMAALFTADIALRENKFVWASWSGMFWGITALCRIDGFLFLPLIIVAHWLSRFLRRDNDSAIAIWGYRFYRVLLPVFILAFAYYYYYSKPYFWDLSRQLLMIGGLFVVALVSHWILPHIKEKFYTHNLLNIIVFGVFALIVILAFLYGHLVRPHLEPYSIIYLPGHELDGTRTYRENTIVNLGLYLSVPMLYMALGGWLTAVWRLWFLRQWQWLLPAVVVAGFSVIYLYDPNITPDHYWAIRRFVPIIIPGFIFFGIWGLSQILESVTSKKKHYFILAIISLCLILFAYNLDKPIAALAENKGYLQQLSLLADKIPDDGIVFAPFYEGYSTPLFVAFNKNIVPIGNGTNDDDVDVLNTLSKQLISGKKAYIISSGTRPAFIGYDVQKIGEITLSRDFMESTIESLPHDVQHEEKTVSIFNIKKGTTKELEYIALGANRVYGVAEDGFYDSEIDSSGNPFRWTNGQAELLVPWYNQDPPKSIHIYLTAVSPQGADLSIKLNEEEVLHEHIKSGPWEKDIPLSGFELKSPIKVEINSNSWRPAEIIPNSDDQRQLGVAVGFIRFNEESGEMKKGSALSKEAAHSKLKLLGSSTITLNQNDNVYTQLKLSHKSDVPWPSQRIVGNPIGSVRLGVIWFSKKEPGKRLAEDRAELPYTIYPGDEVKLTTPLRPVGYDGSALPPGDYEVWVGLLQEGVSWFYEHGDEVIKLDVKVN